MVIDMNLYGEIRRLHLEGISQRKIARTLDISRPTVKKYMDGETVPGKDGRKDYIRNPLVMTDEVIQFICDCLEEDKELNLPKQWHTAKRIYDRLVEEKGFTGSYESIKIAVRKLRANYTPPRGDIPLAFMPADAMQVDFGEINAKVDGEYTKVMIFCARLCYSCACYVFACLSQNTESFLEGLQNAFIFFGGVPERVIFDNGSCAVKSGFGKKAIATDKYKAMAAHYSFKTVFCNVASGNEKGLVENLVGYARKNFAVPMPNVTSLKELNEKLEKDCIRYLNTHKVQNRNETVLQQYQSEQPLLHPVAPFKFDTSRSNAGVKVNDFSLVRFENNSYSVPFRYVGKDVTVKGYALKVVILKDNEVIAEHVRLYGKNHTAFKLDHYIEELKKKPRSVYQAKPVLDCVSKELLNAGHRFENPNKSMVILLTMVIEYGEDTILSILHRHPGPLSIDMIRAELEASVITNVPSGFITSKDIPVSTPSPAVFDKKWRSQA